MTFCCHQSSSGKFSGTLRNQRHDTSRRPAYLLRLCERREHKTASIIVLRTAWCRSEGPAGFPGRWTIPRCRRRPPGSGPSKDSSIPWWSRVPAARKRVRPTHRRQKTIVEFCEKIRERSHGHRFGGSPRISPPPGRRPTDRTDSHFGRCRSGKDSTSERSKENLGARHRTMAPRPPR